jgi:hypothetical protein
VWRSDDEIISDLLSGAPDRIAAGIRDLETRSDLLDEFPLAPLDIPALLAPFGAAVPEETVLGLLRLLTRYDAFVPPLTAETRTAALLDLLLGGGANRLALETSLVLKGADDPAAAVGGFVAALGRCALDSPRAVEGAQWFVSYALAGRPAVRTATLNALQSWPDDAAHRAVIAFVRPELEAEERRRLERT